MKRVWHSGPPPHVGWWNASVLEVEDFWRWWDGQAWSRIAQEYNDAVYAGMQASMATTSQQGIRWTDYYPANARVPRVKP